MNMFARFDENPAITLQDIKETKRYGWTHGRERRQLLSIGGKMVDGKYGTSKVPGK